MGARVHVCGRLAVEWDGERIEDALPGRQGRLLLAFLTLNRKRPVRRDELVEALWSDGRLEGRAELALSFPPDVWVDLEAVRAGLAKAREHQAQAHHAAAWAAARDVAPILEGGLLPGLEADWLDPYRTELEELRCDLLETVARAGAHLGEPELADAERAARRAVELSPFRETARAALIEVLRRRGNAAEALVAYDDFRGLLRDELGSLPGPQLRALHERLLRSGHSASVAAVPALPDRLAHATATAFVGRGVALERLRAAAAKAAAGATEIVFVTGQGGIGKTRLLAELASKVEHFTVPPQPRSSRTSRHIATTGWSSRSGRARSARSPTASACSSSCSGAPTTRSRAWSGRSTGRALCARDPTARPSSTPKRSRRPASSAWSRSSVGSTREPAGRRSRPASDGSGRRRSRDNQRLAACLAAVERFE